MNAPFPRLVVAGTGGDSGKTLIALSIARAARSAGLHPTAFKKGPDYIDAAWLGWAAGIQARNLDTFLMGEDAVRDSFFAHGAPEGMNVIEGNRGLFDGMDAAGTHSTASLARILDAPVILIVPVTKVTASIAAVVHGFATLESDIRIAGVVLNRVGSARQERVIREAVAERTGIPVLGAVPRLKKQGILPERHLGLVPLHERNDLDRLDKAIEEVTGHLDIEGLFELARSAPPMDRAQPDAGGQRDSSGDRSGSARIGVFRDAAFSFYFPENLEALESAGAELVFLSPLTDQRLPPRLDALYLGVGFPETHAERLAANTSMMASVREAARVGLPIYAECGGLMYLSRSITWQGRSFPMAAVLDIEIEVRDRPQGHGYAEVVVDGANPFFDEGTRLKGHEFHYSTIRPADPSLALSLKVLRGHGCVRGRCGIVDQNVFATYVHIHALGEPDWAKAMVKAGLKQRLGKVPVG
ncbi:MAG: cobyrinate a,c-diamide synthase [Deltaproteobacteria bacterium]|nr:cobyrinate a,c-diamide synthase [Deltaproteobacteria bacterium]